MMSYPQTEDDSFTSLGHLPLNGLVMGGSLHGMCILHSSSWNKVTLLRPWRMKTRPSPKFVARNQWDGNLQSNLGSKEMLKHPKSCCCWWPNSNFHIPHHQSSLLTKFIEVLISLRPAQQLKAPTFARKSAAICPSNCASPQTPYLDFPDIYLNVSWKEHHFCTSSPKLSIYLI